MPTRVSFAGTGRCTAIVNTERVQQLLRRGKEFSSRQGPRQRLNRPCLQLRKTLPPEFIVRYRRKQCRTRCEKRIPRSQSRNTAPGKCLLNLREIDRLDGQRPMTLVQFGGQRSSYPSMPRYWKQCCYGARISLRATTFREELFDVFHDVIVDEEDRTRLSILMRLSSR